MRQYFFLVKKWKRITQYSSKKLIERNLWCSFFSQIFFIVSHDVFWWVVPKSTRFGFVCGFELLIFFFVPFVLFFFKSVS